MSSFGDGLPAAKRHRSRRAPNLTDLETASPAANVAAINIEELRESNRRDSRTPPCGPRWTTFEPRRVSATGRSVRRWSLQPGAAAGSARTTVDCVRARWACRGAEYPGLLLRPTIGGYA